MKRFLIIAGHYLIKSYILFPLSLICISSVSSSFSLFVSSFHFFYPVICSYYHCCYYYTNNACPCSPVSHISSCSPEAAVKAFCPPLTSFLKSQIKHLNFSFCYLNVEMILQHAQSDFSSLLPVSSGRPLLFIMHRCSSSSI